LEFLNKRRGKLDAVTISGGEPTLQEDLIPMLREIRTMGFAVKLDTNGSRPDVLASLIQKKLLDFIALDMKAPYRKYADVVNVKVDADLIRESVRLVLKSDIRHEFRTTVVASLLSAKDILEIARSIDGAQRYALQKFQPATTLDKQYAGAGTYSEEQFLGLKKQLKEMIPLIVIR